MTRLATRTPFALVLILGQIVMATRAARADTLEGSPLPPAQAESSKAAVEVRSSAENVTVAEITERVVATSGRVTVQGAAWKDLCISPCSFKLEPGLHEILVYGDGVSSATRKFQLQSGQQSLLVKPGSSALETGGAYLTAAGIVTTLTGLLFLVLFTEATEYHCEIDNSCPEETVPSTTRKLALPLLIGGLAGTGIGIGLYSAGHTSLAMDAQGSSANGKTAEVRQALGVTLRGRL